MRAGARKAVVPANTVPNGPLNKVRWLEGGARASPKTPNTQNVMHRQPPRGIPGPVTRGNRLKITIEPLNLIITVPVKG